MLNIIIKILETKNFIFMVDFNQIGSVFIWK